MAKRFITPFAEAGDRAEISNEPIGSDVNMQTGYPAEYEADPVSDPNARFVERDKTNQLFNDITGNIKHWQENTYPEFITEVNNGGVAFEYKQGDVVTYNGVNYQSLINSNTDIPTSSNWTILTLRVPAFKTVADAKSALYLSLLPENTKIKWQGYYEQSDGGSNWGVLKFGAHTDDGGSIFSIDANTYIEANMKGKSVSVRKFGAKGDNIADDYSSIQMCLDYLEGVGGVVRLPAGSFRTTQTLIIDRSGNTTDPSEGGMVGVDLIGSGAAASRIFSDHEGVCLEFRGGAGAGWHSFLQLKGFGLTKKNFNKAVGSVGLLISDSAYFSIADFDTNHFEYGIKGEDILSGSISNSTIRFNEHGFRFEKVDRTHPNNISFRGVSILNNRTTGGTIIKPHVVSFFGGSVESNGFTGILADANSWGLYVENSGGEGSVGLNLNGVYFENNNGRADVWIQQSTGSVVHNFSGCSFLRFSSTRYTTINIELSAPANNKTRVSLQGCGFRDIPSYTSDISRPFIGSGDAKILDGGGNKYEGTGATPPLNKAVFAPTGSNQKIPYAALPDAVEFSEGKAYCSDMLGSGLPALAVSNGQDWLQIPIGIYSGAINPDGTAKRLPRGWTSSRSAAGVYTITHNLTAATDTYSAVFSPIGAPNTGVCTGQALSGSSVEVYFSDLTGSSKDVGFSFLISRM